MKITNITKYTTYIFQQQALEQALDRAEVRHDEITYWNSIVFNWQNSVFKRFLYVIGKGVH